MTNRQAKSVVRGRPREFCVDDALASALRVFWSKGYERASLTDLTDAMGITRPSLYAAFGNKEALFRKALDLYQREKITYVEDALAQPTARQVAETLLRGAVDSYCDPGEPRGCLGVITASSCGAEAQGVREEVLNRGSAVREALILRLEKAKSEGDLSEHVNIEGLVGLMFALLQGISVQAQAGAARGELERLRETALALWPSS